MSEKIEENIVEVMESSSNKEIEDGNTVNLEQNINVINIDMGKRSLLEKIDYDAVMEWISDHIIHLTIGTMFLMFSIAILIMGSVIIRDKKTIEALTSNGDTVVQVQPDVIPEDSYADVVEDSYETEIIDDVEAAVDENEATEQEVIEEIVEPVTEVDLYDLSLVGETFSEKRYSATNTVGEEFEKVFILSGGVYTETVGFYLNGEYDRFTANISCDESTKTGYFDVNIYLDDGPCIKTIHVERLMAKVPIDIDTTGATFIKFDITGSFYNHGAVLSDGVLHVSDAENEMENQNESGNN